MNTEQIMKLTDEEIWDIYSNCLDTPAGRLQAARAIEAALSAKQGEQEAVAFMYPDDYERMITSETFCTVYSVECGNPTQGKTTVALYTHPAPEAKHGCCEDCVPLSIDGKSVFIDGMGEIPLDFSTPSVNAQERISELEAQNAQLLEALKSALWRMKEYNYQAMEGTIAKATAAIAAVEGKV